MKIKTLTKNQYIKSTSKIKDTASYQFATQALQYCNNYHSWEEFPCICLEQNNQDVCYLFYHLSKDKRYLIIDNLFTPNEYRYCGYAKHILNTIFEKHCLGSVTQRVKMFCVSSSLNFYMKLGIDFWGVNHLGQYYTEFPIPKKGISEIKTLMQKETLSTLYTRELKTIYQKLKLNGSSFDTKQKSIFQNSLKLLGKRYRFKELYDLIHL